jgi:DNA helicase-2/ATP-dependent DNA helicase PcrA
MNARRPAGTRPPAPRALPGPTVAPVDLGAVRPLLAGLDREQRRAVTHRGGPVLVVAGPGTGKTEVITRRIAWLIATKRAMPREILALTFTDKAAAEMLARVDLLVPYGQADSAILTFHSFGDQLLREFGHELGLPDAPRVIGRAEQVVLLREHMFELGLERYRPLGDPTRLLGALADLFGRAKDEAIEPQDLAEYARVLDAGARAAVGGVPDADALIAGLLDEAHGVAELAAAYERYQALLRAQGLVDFGDQVSLAARLVRERPSVAATLALRYRHVLVDEAQDMDPSQLELLRLVASHRELTLVGDDDQAIYAFRGAAVEHLLELSAEPDMRRIVLRTSHRSHAPILAAAHRLISHNDPHRLEARHGLDKRLRPRRRSRRPAEVRDRAFATTADEAEAIATEIAARVGAGEHPRDMAVLVRTNAETAPIAAALRMRDIPVHTGVGERWTGAAEVREVLAFLRVVDDPERSTDLYAVAAGEPYRLGGLDLTAIVAMAARRHRSLWSVLVEVEAQPGMVRLSEATRAGIRHLISDVTAAAEQAHQQPAGRVLYDHLRRSGRYQALVRAAERGDDAPLRRMARLFDVVSTRSTLVADPRLAGLLPHLAGLVDTDDDLATDEDPTDHSEAVAVLTVHRAKGLEFRVVYVAGLVEGRFPLRGRTDPIPLPGALRRREPDEEAMWAEERRLAYVAFTRARDELILSHAVRATPNGRTRRPSPFIAETLDREPSVAPEGTGVQQALALISLPAVEPPFPPVGAPGAPDGPLVLSYSQVDDYLSCPLKYRLRHLVRVPTPPHHALVVGNAMHQAVAAWHLGRLRSRPLGEDGVLEAFAAHWSSEGFLSREHEEARYAAGREALRRFVAETPDPGRRTVSVERSFQVRLGQDMVRGRYDRVDEGPDGVIITDYKSSDVREQRKADERARESLQLQLYALAWEAEQGDLPARLELWFLDSGVVGHAAPDRKRLARARKSLETVAASIRSGDFRARPDRVTCGFCPYRQVCPSSAS